jgi:hypothetical protein
MKPEFPSDPVTAARLYVAKMLREKTITLKEYLEAVRALDAK